MLYYHIYLLIKWITMLIFRFIDILDYYWSKESLQKNQHTILDNTWIHHMPTTKSSKVT